MRRTLQPSHIDRLLQSLVKWLDVVPHEADAVQDRSELPAPWLLDLVTQAANSEQHWRGWMDGRLRVWLFIAKLSLPLSQQLGSPVLQVSCYRESGLKEAACWSIDRGSKWHRVAGGLDEKPEDERLSEQPTLAAIDFYRPDDADT